MKRNKFFLVVILWAIIVCISGFALLRYIKSENDKKKEHDTQVKDYLESYNEWLKIECDYIIKDNKIVINSQTVQMNRLIEDVCLYNTFYQNDEITTDILLEEYRKFCETMEPSSVINSYRKKYREIIKQCESLSFSTGEKNRWYVLVDVYTSQNYGVDDLSASEEQVRIAAQTVAEQVYNEVLAIDN